MNEKKEEKIKELLRANFLDGDEPSDAVSFTAAGVLDVAKFFYEAGFDKGARAVINDIDDIGFGEYNEVVSDMKDELREKWLSTDKQS